MLLKDENFDRVVRSTDPLSETVMVLEMEQLPIVVTDDGKKLVDDSGQIIDCAMNWKDQDAFVALLPERLAAAQ